MLFFFTSLQMFNLWFYPIQDIFMILISTLSSKHILSVDTGKRQRKFIQSIRTLIKAQPSKGKMNNGVMLSLPKWLFKNYTNLESEGSRWHPETDKGAILAPVILKTQTVKMVSFLSPFPHYISFLPVSIYFDNFILLCLI